MPYRDPEKRREYIRQWKENNPDKVKSHSKAYRSAHLERERDDDRTYYEKNKERIKARCNQYNRENRDKINELCARRRRQIKDEVFAAYGGYICACCGETERSFLCIDHIDGGGNEHRRLISGMPGAQGSSWGGGERTYRWLMKNNFPPGFQVLCHNCNFAKGANGECPHETARRILAQEAGISTSVDAASPIPAPSIFSPNVHQEYWEQMSFIKREKDG